MNKGLSLKREERIPLIGLLFSFGFAKNEIATYTNYTPTQIINDLGLLGGMDRYPDRPRKYLEKNANLLKSFARLFLKQKREMDHCEHQALIILSKVVRYNEMVGAIKGMLLTLDYLESFEDHPDFVSDFPAHARLRKALRESHSRNNKWVGREEAVLKTVLRSILKDDTFHKMKSFNVDERHPIVSHLKNIIFQKKEFILKNLEGENFRKKIDEILVRNDFSKNEQFVLRHYFGFGENPKSGKEIGNLFPRKISNQAVYEFKNKAIDKIRLILSVNVGQ